MRHICHCLSPLIFLILPFFVFSCTTTPEPVKIIVKSVTLSHASLKLTEGDQAPLEATILPEDAADKSLVWTSSKESVATVTQDGVVEALSTGTAYITATNKASGKSARCEVKVASKVIYVTGITLDKATASLRAGQTVSLNATVNPSDATDRTVTWTSSDPSVAAVENGTVTAIKVGSSTVTAKAGDKTATCAIIVEATPVISITLDKASVSLIPGLSIILTATVNPSDATDRTVTWTSSDPSVAAVENGTVTAFKVGSAIITAKAGDKQAICIITVNANIPDNSTEHTTETDLF